MLNFTLFFSVKKHYEAQAQIYWYFETEFIYAQKHSSWELPCLQQSYEIPQNFPPQSLHYTMSPHKWYTQPTRFSNLPQFIQQKNWTVWMSKTSSEGKFNSFKIWNVTNKQQPTVYRRQYSIFKDIFLKMWLHYLQLICCNVHSDNTLLKSAIS